MKRLTLLLTALLLVAPAAEGKRNREPGSLFHAVKRERIKGPGPLIRGTVKRGYGKAPKRWKALGTWVTAAPTPAPSATLAPSATSTPTPGSTLPPPSTRSVSVQATEFAFTLSQATVDAGEVRVVFDNSRAEDPHQLAIDGPDPDFWTFPELPAGAVSRLVVTLRPGRHLLVCPLPGHEELGMRAVLTVR